MKTDPAAACRFFTPGDACRAALAAYRAATECLRPPFGHPWLIDGQPFATASDFADNFVAEIVAQVGLLALDRLGEFVPPEERGDPWSRAYLAAPEKMRPIIAQRAEEMRDLAAEFGIIESHELQPGGNARHNADAQGGSANVGG